MNMKIGEWFEAWWRRFGNINTPHTPKAISARAFYSVTGELAVWAVSRWNAEVKDRPLNNVHRRALDDTWRQVIRNLGEDDVTLLGPRHDDLVMQNPELARRGSGGDPAALQKRLDDIKLVIDCVENRCLAADGAVTNTRVAMTDAELQAIYKLAGGIIRT